MPVMPATLLSRSADADTMARYNSKILLAMAVLLVIVAASSGKDLNTRMTPGERTQAFAKMKERFKKIEPACIPSEHPGESTKPLPTVPDSFTTNVEIAFEEKKMKVIYGAESFDGVLNTGVLRYELSEGIILGRPKDRQEIIHYSIPTDEALFIIANEACEDEGEENCDPKTRCHAGKLEDLSAELRELFGYSDVNGNDGYYGAGGILQWGPQYNYEYRGASDCRGMRCDRYETCITKPDENATVSITYFWSDKAWNVTTNGAQVPVAIEIYATGKFGHIFQREVMQRYDFYDFYRDVRPDPDEFEAGIVGGVGRLQREVPSGRGYEAWLNPNVAAHLAEHLCRHVPHLVMTHADEPTRLARHGVIWVE